MNKLLVASLALASALGAVAQFVSVPPANVPLRTVVSAAADDQPSLPTYEIALKWNERDTTVLTVPLKNTGDKAMKILGVQATRGIFIGDFPAAIPAGKEDAIAFVYSAADNSDGDVDLIRVLTDQGLKEILVKIVREAAAKFDTRELSWSVGDPASTKSVQVTVVADTAKPQKVRVAGGHQAILTLAGTNTWKINVTPSSTAKSGKFAVFVDFDKPLPGTAPVILGVIQAKE